MLYTEHTEEPGEVLGSIPVSLHYPLYSTTNHLLGASLRWATGIYDSSTEAKILASLDVFVPSQVNPLPDMPVLGSSTSAANKDMMS